MPGITSGAKDQKKNTKTTDHTLWYFVRFSFTRVEKLILRAKDQVWWHFVLSSYYEISSMFHFFMKYNIITIQWCSLQMEIVSHT